MAQSLAQMLIHIIFSTKNREPFLADEELRHQMHAYLATVFNQYDSPAVLGGGGADHVHILCRLSRNYAVAKVIGEAKRNSSKWAKFKGRILQNFQWQNGYGAFSISQSHQAQVRAYIARPEAHHRRQTFQDEFREFLKRYEVEYDERYVWD